MSSIRNKKENPVNSLKPAETPVFRRFCREVESRKTSTHDAPIRELSFENDRINNSHYTLVNGFLS
jgi:hypothetical protein